MPWVPVTRIPAHTAMELQNYLTNAAAWCDLHDARALPSRALVHLGDEVDSGNPPDSSVAFYQTDLFPFLYDHWYGQTVQRDSDYGANCDEYQRSHRDLAAFLNTSNMWPTFWANLGPASSSLKTPGYILHKGSACNSWDGSLLQAGQHPTVVFGAACGLAGIFRMTDYAPSLAEMFLVGAASKPNAVAWIGAQSGGSETLHLEWYRLWLWAWAQSTNVHDTYWLSLTTFAALHPGQIEYASGMEYLGLPLPWPYSHNPASVESRGESQLISVFPNPIRGSAKIVFSLPPCPRGTPVTLDLYEVGGRRVRRMDATNLPGEILWNGRTDLGQVAASGTYFLTLVLNGVRLSATKVVVAR